MSSGYLGYPRTLHLDASGLGGSASSRERLAWTDLAGRNVVLEEKMDGSETSFEFNDEIDPVLRYRGSPLDLSSRGGAEKQFDGFKDWFELNADSFFDRFDTRYRVYGEWLFAAHRVFYDALPCHFLEFDILDKRDGRFLDTPGRRELMSALPTLHSVRVMAEGAAVTLGHPSKLVGPSAFKSPDWRLSAAEAASRARLSAEAFMARIDTSDLAEGIYGKVEENGEVTLRFKWVRPEFVSGIVSGGRHWKDMALVPNGVVSEAAPSSAYAPPIP
ncbi:RNA ligase family protein [Pararhizobium sp. BT-229]|uniref:RNA ligase family protein n=1 Tax=Pararhizobium sp. BT-229 TaxID=2986923 RepID=UPI0021F7CB9E|nr:RNA ligase family protein [Pararhizobium sp. BT-229]MCV9963545.1 RNA ligase family protein [Pararhizobium sp. BT-229]